MTEPWQVEFLQTLLAVLAVSALFFIMAAVIEWIAKRRSK